MLDTLTIPPEHCDLFRVEAEDTVRYARNEVKQAVRWRQRGVRDEVDATLERLNAATRLLEGVEQGRRHFVPDYAFRQTVVGCLLEAEHVLRLKCEAFPIDFAKARTAHARVGAFLDLLEKIERGELNA